MKTFKQFLFILFSIILSLILLLKVFTKDKERNDRNYLRDTLTKISYTKEFLLGKINYRKDTNFVELPLKYASGEKKYLLKEVAKAFCEMSEAAKKEGITLIAVSCTRNFDEQRAIWEAKWSGKKLVEGKNLSKTISDPVRRAKIILKYSSMPGTSRHHWGTDIDINSVDKSYFETEQGKKVIDWLKKNAVKFGFCQPYCKIDGVKRNSGYEEEPWHWSYYPIASKILAEYLKKINYSDITGFSGCEVAEKINLFQNYVMAISKDCNK